MAHPYHHAVSSVKIWGGTVDDFIAIHQWFDESKVITADFRHRALRHHAEGIFMLERFWNRVDIVNWPRCADPADRRTACERRPRLHSEFRRLGEVHPS